MIPVLIPSMLQTGIGLIQNLFGMNKAKNLKRPVRTTPGAVQEAVGRTRYQAQAGERPQSAAAKENIQTTQAGATAAASKAGGSAATTMATALGAQEQANKALQQQDYLDMQAKEQANMQYLQALDSLAREQATNWQWNEAQKFTEEADAARRLQESGGQNLFGGLNTITQHGFMKKMGYFDQGNKGGGANMAQMPDPTTLMQNLAMLYQAPSMKGQFQSMPG
jgi:hypothetical protein